jgi:hypothetical protein
MIAGTVLCLVLSPVIASVEVRLELFRFFTQTETRFYKSRHVHDGLLVPLSLHNLLLYTMAQPIFGPSYDPVDVTTLFSSDMSSQSKLNLEKNNTETMPEWATGWLPYLSLPWRTRPGEPAIRPRQPWRKSSPLASYWLPASNYLCSEGQKLRGVDFKIIEMLSIN